MLVSNIGQIGLENILIVSVFRWVEARFRHGSRLDGGCWWGWRWRSFVFGSGGGFLSWWRC
jgi:hypothetical protein